jgi:ABC-2 type transport system ATP-binding protein/lipopolysaccharide transport system ATP-binding protein
VEKICDRVIWLKDGKIKTLGEPKRIIDAYLQDIAEQQEEVFEQRQQRVNEEYGEKKETVIRKAGDEKTSVNVQHAVPADEADEHREQRWGKREIEIKKVRLTDLKGKPKHVFQSDEGMIIGMEIKSYSRIKDFVFGLGIFNSQGIQCYGTNTQIEEFQAKSIEGKCEITCRIEKLSLINGTYYLDVAVHKIDGYPYDYHRNLYSFMVSSLNKDVGIFRPEHEWSFSGKIQFKPSKD